MKRNQCQKVPGVVRSQARRPMMISALMLLGFAVLGTQASAVSGAAFTTFNAAADGAGKDVCKNTAINCNIYGAKEYVWLNGGPAANGLGPDGEYFFAVLEPGGQPDPNDGGAKNLSDYYDEYTNRTFTVANGEVSAYFGTHDYDPPLIRLFPYLDTTNPGGVYILAICSLGEGYPVDPRDCKYDAFKVKRGKVEYSFMLSGMKFEDMNADGVEDDGDLGLEGWLIQISGLGPDGEPFSADVYTDADGHWEWTSPTYSFSGKTEPMDVSVTVCEMLQAGWTQSYPPEVCYNFGFTPSGFDFFPDLDFGNWQPVDVTGCKVKDLDGREGGETIPVPGWEITLTEGGEPVETQVTGEDGCYTWTDLTPGVEYDLHEETRDGWVALGETDIVFDESRSGDSLSHTFVNTPVQGCTPGFWQGGSDGGQAGGQWLWNEVNDPQWALSGGDGTNPYTWDTLFNAFFTPYAGLNGLTMLDLVGTGGGSEDYRKAARSLVAAYLNASWGMAYAYTTSELELLWAAAVADGSMEAFLALHTALDAANNAFGRPDSCPVSASLNF